MALTQVSTGGIKDGQVHTADLADAQITAGKLHADALDHTYTLGASGTDHYTFTGEGLTGAVNDPTLYLTRGKTYRFVNGNSSGAHPFRIQSVAGAGGTEYNTGVTNNAGAGGSTIIFEVPHDAPDVLYYICTSHPAMNGIFYVTGALADGTVTTAKLAADAVTGAKIADDAIDSEHFADGSIDTAHIADQAVTLAKLPHGDGSSDGKFLRSNNGADPTFESLPASGVTVGNAADERVVTSDGTNLDAETLFVYRAAKNTVGIGTASPEPTASYYEGACLHIHQAASGGSVGAQVHLTNDYGGSAAGDGSQVSHYNHSLYINNQENGDTYFYNNGSSSLTIKADGKVGVKTQAPSQELHVNGDIQASSIFLGGTGTANQLEDYEEGTFSPTVGGTSSNPTQSYAHQYGYYTKIGNLCFCSVDISFANSGISGGSGEANLESLPFNVANLTNNYGITASVGYSPSWGSITPTSGYAIPNTNYLKLMGGDRDTGTNFVQSSQVGNSTRLIAGFTYRTA